ncbi:MAG: septum formation initiator family protein [Deltaproteobacteria bacterium]|nr:septum formation initiator family protein [Deltaproteobacteria bacterium]
MKRLFSGLLLLVIFYFVWLTWFGSRGDRALRSVEHEIKRIGLHNQELKADNQLLEHKIRLLQSDARYQELVVRRELHMIRENEILFLFEAQ